MASEMIRAILAAEEECKQKETEARKNAEAKKQKAKEDADQLIADAKKQVDSMINDDAAAVSRSAELRLEKEKKKFSAECDALSAKASKNLNKVTDLVIESIVQ